MPVSAPLVRDRGALARGHPAARRVLREGPRSSRSPSVSARDLAWVLGARSARSCPPCTSRDRCSSRSSATRRDEARAHEAPALMHAPLAVLAFLSVVGGAVLGLTAEGRLATFLEPVGRESPSTGTGSLSEPVLTVDRRGRSRVAAVASAFWIWASGRVDWQAFPERPARARRLALERLLPEHALRLARPASGQGPRPGAHRSSTTGSIDGAVNEVGEDVGKALRPGRRSSSRGFVRAYALAFLLGAVALLLTWGSGRDVPWLTVLIFLPLVGIPVLALWRGATDVARRAMLALVVAIADLRWSRSRVLGAFDRRRAGLPARRAGGLGRLAPACPTWSASTASASGSSS